MLIGLAAPLSRAGAQTVGDLAAGDLPTIVVLGDSLVAGYGLQPGEDWPARMQAALADSGVNVEMVNAGQSGDTSSGGLSRLDWSIPDGTDGVIIELGANDALRGIPVELTAANIDAMIVRLKERGIPVMLMGMRAPPNMGPEYATAFDAIYAEAAERHSVPLYPFFLDGVAAEPSLNLSDGMHPNAAGIDEMVRRTLPAVSRFAASLGGEEAASR